jgi:hypothetical protein
VFAATRKGSRFSTARKTPHAKCRSRMLEPQNQPSLVTLTNRSGAWPRSRSAATCRRIRCGTVLSKQMLGAIVAPGVTKATGSLPGVNPALIGVMRYSRGNHPAERDVLAEHHQMHLEVPGCHVALRIDQQGRVMTLDASRSQPLRIGADDQPDAVRRPPPASAPSCSGPLPRRGFSRQPRSAKPAPCRETAAPTPGRPAEPPGARPPAPRPECPNRPIRARRSGPIRAVCQHRVAAQLQIAGKTPRVPAPASNSNTVSKES